jgi:hypothetical protein
VLEDPGQHAATGRVRVAAGVWLLVVVGAVEDHVGKGSSLVRRVELRGFEPLAFSMRTRRATNCATAPLHLRCSEQNSSVPKTQLN